MKDYISLPVFRWAIMTHVLLITASALAVQQQKKQKREQLREEAVALQTAVDARTYFNNPYIKQLEVDQSRLTALEQKNKQLVERSTCTNSCLCDLEHELAAMHTALEAAEKTIKAQEEQLTALSQALAEHEHTVNHLRTTQRETADAIAHTKTSVVQARSRVHAQQERSGANVQSPSGDAEPQAMPAVVAAR